MVVAESKDIKLRNDRSLDKVGRNVLKLRGARPEINTHELLLAAFLLMIEAKLFADLNSYSEILKETRFPRNYMLFLHLIS